MGPVTIGIDVGTTSVKGLAVDDEGRVMARSRVAHRALATSPERLEHDADAAWRAGPRAAVEALGDVEPVAMAVSAMAPSMTAVDARGVPVGPGLLYGDERGRHPDGEGAGPGRGEVGADPSRSPEMMGLLRWTVAHAPGAAGYWPAQAVVNRALGATPTIDLGTAFAAGPLLGADGWDEETCAACGVDPGQLPAIALFGDVIGRAGPVGAGAMIGVGGVDAFCEQLVAGADAAGDVLVVCGASLVVWAPVSGEPTVPGIWTLPHWRGGSMVGGASNAGGLWLDWVDRSIRPADPGAARPSAVPVLLPYVRGERVPLHDPGRRAEMRGLDLTQGPAELRRGAFESSGFAARHILERSGVDARRIVASGGGSRVAPWMQALADVTGLPVDTVAVPEGAALGAAFLARLAAGLETRMEDAGRWARTGHRYSPDPVWQEAADERYGAYRHHAGL